MTRDIKWGGSAFPVPCYEDHWGDRVPASEGMTLRDWFAGQALSAFNGPPTNEAESQFRAAVAYQLADAMLAERSKP
jgi:hypothetical protein